MRWLGPCGPHIRSGSPFPTGWTHVNGPALARATLSTAHAFGSAGVAGMPTERDYCPRHPDKVIRTRYLVNDDGRSEEEYVEVTPCPRCGPREESRDQDGMR